MGIGRIPDTPNLEKISLASPFAHTIRIAKI